MFVVSVVSDLDVVHRLYFTSMLACVVVGSRGIISLLHGAHPYIQMTTPATYLLCWDKGKERNFYVWPFTGSKPIFPSRQSLATQPTFHRRRFLGRHMLAVRQCAQERKEEIRTRFHIKYLGLFLFKTTRGLQFNVYWNV